MGTKPPAAVGERISKDGRHDLGAVAMSSIETSSRQGRPGGSTSTPNVIVANSARALLNREKRTKILTLTAKPPLFRAAGTDEKY